MGWTRRRLLGVGAAAGLGAVGLAAACSDEDGASSGPATSTVPPREVRYGAADVQLLELTLPSGPTPDRGWPLVVLVHGGFWSAQYDRSLMRPLVPSLVAQGWAVANIDYRGVGAPGGGWPGTLEDAAAAVDALPAAEPALDPARAIALGHSAGGHLAVWLAARHRLPEGAPGSAPQLRLTGAVAQAGVVDLVAAAQQRLGSGATQALLGGEPDAVPDRYAVASPAALVPLGVPVALVHGTADDIVPLDQSRRYDAAARAAGDDVTLTTVPGDHFAVIDPTTEAWAACLAAAQRLLA
jgi:dipeptidyl aminopeptidase/acylaminoacyl peptidase